MNGRSIHLPQGPVSYKYIEVGKTFYQAEFTDTPRFPARAAHAMLTELLRQSSAPVALYDPFCGNGVLLVTAFLFFAHRLDRIIGSDIQPLAVETTRRNIHWLLDAQALEERLSAIAAYKTENGDLKAAYQQKCRLLFAHAQGIGPHPEVFAHDARQIGTVLASMGADVAVATDPPYTDPQADPSVHEGIDRGLLEPFLHQLALAPTLRQLVLCYRLGPPIVPLLEQYFDVSPRRGTRGRGIYVCTKKQSL